MVFEPPIMAKTPKPKLPQQIPKRKRGPEMNANETELRQMYHDLINRYKTDIEEFRVLDEKRIQLNQEIYTIKKKVDELTKRQQIVDQEYRSLNLDKDETIIL